MKAHMIDGELMLHGPVGFSFWDDDGLMASDIREVIAGTSGDLTVHLNSGGGVATEGAAIHSVLSAYPGNVTVLVEGIAASAASLLAMAADDLVMTEGSLLMIHDPSGVTIGDASEHAKQMEVLNTMADEYARVYAKRTGKTPEEMREVMKSEIWLAGADAVEQGFADRVASDQPEITASAFPYQNYNAAPQAIMAVAGAKGWLAERQDKGAEKPKTPAAPAANKLEATMAEKDTPAGKVTPEDKSEVVVMTAESKAALDAKARRTMVMSMNSGDVLTAAEVEDVVEKSGDVADAKMAAADLIVAKRIAEEGPQIKQSATITADVTERFKAGATDGLMMKAGIGGARNEFTGMSLRELARHSLDVNNVRPSGNTALDMVGTAFTMAGGLHSGSDFTSILADVANKAMLRGYEEAEETFQQWTVAGSVSDFKPTKRVDLDTFPSLREVPDGAEYKHGTMGDHGETITIATYGELFSISRQTIINDDLGAFTRVPMKMGRAAIRTVGNLAYAVLTDNAAMSDGTALFHADHNNLASSGVAPSVTSFNSAFEAMGTQVDRSENAHALNIRPRFGIFPITLRSQALQVLESEHDPAKTSRSANIARNMVEPIFDGRLTGTNWYFAADPSRIDTVEVSYLDGNQSPFLDQQDTWTRDGSSFKVRIEAGAKALAWQGLYSNPGA